MVFITVASLFDESCRNWCQAGVLGRAINRGLLSLSWLNPRDFSLDNHRRIDDVSFGGGPGMLMSLPPLVRLIQSAEDHHGPSHKILLSPAGAPLRQKKVEWLSSQKHLLLICGRYEGIDSRINHFIDEEISIGDYILSGGELGALVIIDAIARLKEGSLGNHRSHQEETFSDGLLEYPQYTKPIEFNGYKVPKILLSGHHQLIKAFRHWQALLRTKTNRSDLLVDKRLSLTDQLLIQCETQKEFLKLCQKELKISFDANLFEEE